MTDETEVGGGFAEMEDDAPIDFDCREPLLTAAAKLVVTVIPILNLLAFMNLLEEKGN